jgi:hypothetical protein
LRAQAFLSEETAARWLCYFETFVCSPMCAVLELTSSSSLFCCLVDCGFFICGFVSSLPLAGQAVLYMWFRRSQPWFEEYVRSPWRCADHSLWAKLWGPSAHLYWRGKFGLALQAQGCLIRALALEVFFDNGVELSAGPGRPQIFVRRRRAIGAVTHGRRKSRRR